MSEDKKPQNITIMAWRDRTNPQYGGAEVYLDHMAQKLAREGHKVTFLTSSYKGANQQETVNGVRYIRRGSLITMYILLPMYYLLNLKKQTDLLIESYNFMPFWTPIYEKNRFLIIYHIQTVEWVRFFGSLLGTLLSKIVRFFFPRIYRGSRIVTISESSRSEIEKLDFKPKSLDIVYTGIDLPLATDTARPKDTINISYFGRLRKTKNVDLAIELVDYAIKELKIPNIKMSIAGQGEAEESLKQLVKQLNLEDHVEFLGYISEEEKPQFLRSSHLFVLLSEKEGWGITAVEAASQGTPTFCMDVPGLRDSIKPEIGFVAKNKSLLKQVWGQTLEEIAQNSQSYQDKQQACIKWAAKFKWEEQEQRFYDLVASAS